MDIDIRHLGCSPLRHTTTGREKLRCRTQIERWTFLYERDRDTKSRQGLELWRQYEALISGPLDLTTIKPTWNPILEPWELPRPPKNKLEEKTDEDKIVEQYYLSCRSRANVVRRSGWTYRICMEFAHARLHGWTAVFHTLTCRDDTLDKVFSGQHSWYWTTYLRNFRQLLAEESNSTYREIYNDTKSYHRYFAVVELGDANRRLHIHCIHFVPFVFTPGGYRVRDRTLPDGGTEPREELELPTVSSTWPFGLSHAIALRLCDTDSYSKLVRWPRSVRPDGKIDWLTPAPMLSDMQLAHYLTKYLTKEKTSDIFVNKWRTKASKHLGMWLIAIWVKTLTRHQHYLLMHLPESLTIEINRDVLSIPKDLLIYVMERAWMNSNPTTANLLFEPRTSIRERVRSQINPSAGMSLSPTNLQPSHLAGCNAMADYDSLLQRLRSLHDEYCTRTKLETALTRGADAQ